MMYWTTVAQKVREILLSLMVHQYCHVLCVQILFGISSIIIIHVFDIKGNTSICFNAKI